MVDIRNHRIGCVLEAGKVTRTGRLYPENIVDAAIEKLQKPIADNMFLGTIWADRPVHLADVTHLIKNIERRGPRIDVDVELLNTPNGVEVQEYVRRNGCKELIAYPVGVGRVRQEGDVTIVEEYEMQQISLESRDYLMRDRGLPLYDRLKKQTSGAKDVCRVCGGTTYHSHPYEVCQSCHLAFDKYGMRYEIAPIHNTPPRGIKLLSPKNS